MILQVAQSNIHIYQREDVFALALKFEAACMIPMLNILTPVLHLLISLFLSNFSSENLMKSSEVSRTRMESRLEKCKTHLQFYQLTETQLKSSFLIAILEDIIFPFPFAFLYPCTSLQSDHFAKNFHSIFDHRHVQHISRARCHVLSSLCRSQWNKLLCNTLPSTDIVHCNACGRKKYCALRIRCCLNLKISSKGELHFLKDN